MSFYYQNNQLYAEQINITKIIKQFGTPCYIYSRAAIEKEWHAFDNALKDHPHRVCYAVKANSNLAILNILARIGSGFDIVSGGELLRVLKAQGKPQTIIFSGVGKSVAEIKMAIEHNIFCFNVESPAELTRIEQIAQSLNKQVPIALRINPNIDAGTHPYISTGLKENKFGIEIEEALNLYQIAAKSNYLKIVGIASHIGSQLLELAPFLKMLDHLLELVDILAQQNVVIQHLDIGGGLGICYRDEQPPSAAAYGAAVLEKVKGRNIELILEPGRAIVANAGLLVTEIEYLKHTAEKNFVIVNAGMNDLIRPALYEAWQEIIPVTKRFDVPAKNYEVVGPVCETADFLGKQRQLSVAAGDLLAIKSAGAYGFVMSSNYNSRPRVPEIMVDNDKIYLVRRREELVELFSTESMILE